MVKVLEEIASEGLNYFDYHVGEDEDAHSHSHGTDTEKPANEADRPVVITGTAGTGTRVANDILEHAGNVHMGGRRNKQRDSTEFDDYVKRYVEDLLRATNGRVDYAISELPDELAARIRKGVDKFASVMEGTFDAAGTFPRPVIEDAPHLLSLSKWPVGLEGKPSDVLLPLLVRKVPQAEGRVSGAGWTRHCLFQAAASSLSRR